MFRVDVYQPKEDKPSLSPLYACLATASEDGRLLTVGRKNATILLETDKSVSRDHLHLHLMSKNKEQQEPLELNGENEPVAPGAMAPQNPEEIVACDENPRGMALLVKNFGKFGTAVLALEPKDEQEQPDKKDVVRKKATGNDSETDAGGSDTEDESQQVTSSSGGLPVLPGVAWFENTKKIASSFINVKMTPKKLDGKEDFVVPGKASTIFIQCGQTGSLLVLNRLDLNICKSSLSKEDASMWKDRLYSVGAVLREKDVDSFMISTKGSLQTNKISQGHPPTTYLVTKSKREATVKQLIAWLLDIPVITSGFLDALVHRKSPQDPWPKASDFSPSNCEIKGVDGNFWDINHPLRSRLWESCTFLCTYEKHTEMEYLVQAMGGSVVQLYGIKEEDAQNRVKELLDDPNRKDGLFTISSSGRKKIVKWVKDQGIPQLSPKSIIIFVCNHEMPQDKETGRTIGHSPVDKIKEARAEKTGKKPEEASRPSDERATVSYSKTSARNGPADEKNESQNESNIDKLPKRKRKPDLQEGIEKETAAGFLSKKPRKDGDESQSRRFMEVLPPVQEENSMNMNSTSVESVEHDQGPEGKTFPRKRPSRDEEPPCESNKKPGNRGFSQTKGKERARLRSTDDGWFVAAPKNESFRKAYVKPPEEMLENCSLEKPPSAAEAVVCTGLVCRSYDPNQDATIEADRKPKREEDFKKFVKNSIIMAPRQSTIPLLSVTPKESERRKQLEEHQRTLEAQQRKADELFHGTGSFGQSRGGKKAATTTRKRRNV